MQPFEKREMTKKEIKLKEGIKKQLLRIDKSNRWRYFKTLTNLMQANEKILSVIFYLSSPTHFIKQFNFCTNQRFANSLFVGNLYRYFSPKKTNTLTIFAVRL
jgi:hypothetical protein